MQVWGVATLSSTLASAVTLTSVLAKAVLFLASKMEGGSGVLKSTWAWERCIPGWAGPWLREQQAELLSVPRAGPLGWREFCCWAGGGAGPDPDSAAFPLVCCGVCGQTGARNPVSFLSLGVVYLTILKALVLHYLCRLGTRVTPGCLACGLSSSPWCKCPVGL